MAPSRPAKWVQKEAACGFCKCFDGSLVKKSSVCFHRFSIVIVHVSLLLH